MKIQTPTGLKGYNEKWAAQVGQTEWVAQMKGDFNDDEALANQAFDSLTKKVAADEKAKADADAAAEAEEENRQAAIAALQAREDNTPAPATGPQPGAGDAEENTGGNSDEQP